MENGQKGENIPVEMEPIEPMKVITLGHKLQMPSKHALNILVIVEVGM